MINFKDKDEIVRKLLETEEGRTKLAMAMVEPLRAKRFRIEICSTCGEDIERNINECCSMERILKK